MPSKKELFLTFLDPSSFYLLLKIKYKQIAPTMFLFTNIIIRRKFLLFITLFLYDRLTKPLTVITGNQQTVIKIAARSAKIRKVCLCGFECKNKSVWSIVSVRVVYFVLLFLWVQLRQAVIDYCVLLFQSNIGYCRLTSSNKARTK